MENVTESISVTRNANGSMTATVTLTDGKLSAKWSVKTYSAHVKQSVIEARAEAEKVLDTIREATRTALSAVS